MADLGLRKHVAPVAHNTIGSTLSTLIVLAGAAMISWLAARSAYLTQQPLYRAILMGGVVFLIIAVGVLAISFALSLFRRRPETSRPTSTGDDDWQARYAEKEQQFKTTFAHLEASQKENDLLNSRLRDVEWLSNRAKHQATQIEQVVTVSDVYVSERELKRRDPYVEFTVQFWNRSIYDIEIMDLVGTLGLDGREFREELEWTRKQSDRVVWSQNPAAYIFRQNLTDEDVEHIRIARAHFNFNKLELFVTGTSESQLYVKPQRIAWGAVIPTNEPLVVTTLGEKWTP